MAKAHQKAIDLYNDQKRANTLHKYNWQVARHPFSRNWTTVPLPGFCNTLSYRCIEKETLTVVKFSSGEAIPGRIAPPIKTGIIH